MTHGTLQAVWFMGIGQRNFKGPIMNTMDNLFNELEAEMLKQFKAITPKQLEIEEHRRKLQRQYEASLNNIETDDDRDNKEEYPDEDEDEE